MSLLSLLTSPSPFHFGPATKRTSPASSSSWANQWNFTFKLLSTLTSLCHSTAAMRAQKAWNHPSHQQPVHCTLQSQQDTQCPVLCCSQPEGSCHQLLHPKHVCTAHQGLVLADILSYQNISIKGKRAASTRQMWQHRASLSLWEQLIVTPAADTKPFRVWRHQALKHWYHYWVSSSPPIQKLTLTPKARTKCCV